MALEMVSVNWFAILVATVVSFLFGWIWYGLLFGKIWANVKGEFFEIKDTKQL